MGSLTIKVGLTAGWRSNNTENSDLATFKKQRKYLEGIRVRFIKIIIMHPLKISKVLLLIAVILTSSCRKDISENQGITIPVELPDLESKITSSASGFITDENNIAVAGAAVTFGMQIKSSPIQRCGS
jgi:hypothetical protein